MNTLAKSLERLLFQTRLLILVPVVISLILALAVLVVAVVDSFSLVGRVVDLLNPALAEAARADLDKALLSKVIELIDDFLLVSILIVFSFGLYELFIDKIDVVEQSNIAERLLLIKSLDDLKSRLANVVLLILIVKFFQVAINQKYSNVGDLLLLAVGIALIGITLYLTNKGHSSDGAH